jgi:hypothetical protein
VIDEVIGVGTRSSAAVLVTLALLVASCSISSDGLATTGVDETELSPPARVGNVPGAGDGGATSSSSAPPVVNRPDAGAVPSVPGVDAGVPLPVDGPVNAPPMTAPPVAPPSPVSPPPVPKVMRAHDVKAKRITAGTIYVHKLEAKTGSAGNIVFLPAPLVDLGLGTNVEVDELVVETLYAHDVKADDVQITETHAAEVKIGKKGAGGPGPD